jgi:hypothetical protein
MMDGLIAKQISDSGIQGPLEIELMVTDPGQSGLDGQDLQAPGCFTLSVVLVLGPPDPNVLAYLLPRQFFKQDVPIHVGALAVGADDQSDLSEPILDIIEVMAPGDRVVFLCQDVATLNEACLTLGLNPPETGTD